MLPALSVSAPASSDTFLASSARAAATILSRTPPLAGAAAAAFDAAPDPAERCFDLERFGESERAACVASGAAFAPPDWLGD
jgi:hypothetical protein